MLGYELLANFKNEAKKLRSEIDELVTNLTEQADACYTDCHPEIYQDWKNLKWMIKQQYIEKAKLLSELDGEQRRTEEQRDMVAICKERVLRMEEQVGIIADNPNYVHEVQLTVVKTASDPIDLSQMASLSPKTADDPLFIRTMDWNKNLFAVEQSQELKKSGERLVSTKQGREEHEKAMHNRLNTRSEVCTPVNDKR